MITNPNAVKENVELNGKILVSFDTNQKFQELANKDRRLADLVKYQ